MYVFFIGFALLMKTTSIYLIKKTALNIIGFLERINLSPYLHKKGNIFIFTINKKVNL
jgi:hypothetical protein